jgi:hypothetical protein
MNLAMDRSLLIALDQALAADLQALGRDAARDVAGEESVEGVEVTIGEGVSDRPAYQFTFLINQSRERPGLVRIRLGQKLKDALAARGDEHYPMLRILNRADWDKRA